MVKSESEKISSVAATELGEVEAAGRHCMKRMPLAAEMEVFRCGRGYDGGDVADLVISSDLIVQHQRGVVKRRSHAIVFSSVHRSPRKLSCC